MHFTLLAEDLGGRPGRRDVGALFQRRLERPLFCDPYNLLFQRYIRNYL